MNLVGDIGGTHARLALADANGLRAGSVWRGDGLDQPGLEARVADMAQGAHAICLAGAGPVVDSAITLTNAALRLDPHRLHLLTGLPVHVVNDMTAQGWGLDVVPTGQTRALAGPRTGQGTRLLVNIGTGFNAVPVLNSATGLVVPMAEAGFAPMPGGPEGATIEDILSGRALVPGQLEDASQAACIADALARVLALLARVHLPLGGILLTGGVALALADRLDWAAVHRGICGADGASALLASVPLTLIADPHLALRGAARIAAAEGC